MVSTCSIRHDVGKRSQGGQGAEIQSWERTPCIRRPLRHNAINNVGNLRGIALSVAVDEWTLLARPEFSGSAAGKGDGNSAVKVRSGETQHILVKVNGVKVADIATTL